MKRVGKVFLCLIVALLFGYLLIFDYPATMRSLTPKVSSVAQDVEPSDTSMQEQKPEAPHSTTEDTMAQIPRTKAVLLVSGIQQAVYDNVYPVLHDAGYTATLLFMNGHLTGDYGQMSTVQFQKLIDDGWEFAIGGISTDLSAEDWRSSLLEELSSIEQRSGVQPSAYYFRSGEYRTELDIILQEEGFSSLYYTPEDAANAVENVSGMRRICYVPFSAETELQGVLDQAWSYDSVAMGVELDPDAEDVSGDQWTELISLLSTDGRFNVMSQSDWQSSEPESDSDREALVAAVLASKVDEAD